MSAHAQDLDLWVPLANGEPPMSVSERLLCDRLIRAEAAAAKYELALRTVLAVGQMDAHAVAKVALAR